MLILSINTNFHWRNSIIYWPMNVVYTINNDMVDGWSSRTREKNTSLKWKKKTEYREACYRQTSVWNTSLWTVCMCVYFGCIFYYHSAEYFRKSTWSSENVSGLVFNETRVFEEKIKKNYKTESENWKVRKLKLTLLWGCLQIQITTKVNVPNRSTSCS